MPTTLDVQREITSMVGWIDIGNGPECMFCEQPARWGKLQDDSITMLWKCQPCETTWRARWL